MLLGLAVGLLGLLVNLNPIHMGFGLELLLGGVGTYFLMRVAGGRAAFLASLLSSAATIVVFGHPWVAVLLVGETVFCLWLKKTKQVDPLIAVPLYWFFVGAPQSALYYGVILDLPAVTMLATMTQQAVNGLANVAMGSLAASIVMAAAPGLRSRHARSLRVAILEVLVAFTIIPVLVYSAITAQDYEAQRDASDLNTVNRAARNASVRADTLLEDLRRETELIARLLTGSDLDGAEPAIGTILLPYALERVLVSDRRGTVIASLGAGGTLNAVTSTATPAAVEPVTAGLLLFTNDSGRASPALRVILSEPDGTIEGWGVAFLDPDRFRQYVLPTELTPGVSVSVVSDTGQVIISTYAGADALTPDGGADPYVFGRQAPLQVEGIPGDISAAVPLRMGAWLVVAHSDAAASSAAYQWRLAEFLGSIFIIAVIGVFASAGVARMVTRPLERVARSLESSPAPADSGPHRPLGLLEADALSRALDASRRRAERYNAENLVLSQRLQSLVAHAPVILYSAEADGDGFTLRYASPGLKDSLGLALEAGAPYAGIQRWVHPADAERVERERARLFSQGRFSAEYRLVRAPEPPIWVSEVAVLVRDATGAPLEIVGVFMDVTTRRAADARMQQSAKLITLGEMATGLAHELNQPLNVIRMAAQNGVLALEDMSDPQSGHDTALRKLARIEVQVQRASRLIDHMRIFGRRPEDISEVFSVVDAVTGAMSIIGAQLKIQGIDIDIATPATPPLVRGSSQQLEHAIMNIVLNARDAIVSSHEGSPTPLRGRVTIAVTSGGGSVWIEIGDSGGGIDPLVLDTLFEPFVTTKPPGKGTGLGLSLTFGIVSDMGGRMSAENGPDGAIFRIDLPESLATNDSGTCLAEEAMSSEAVNSAGVVEPG